MHFVAFQRQINEKTDEKLKNLNSLHKNTPMIDSMLKISKNLVKPKNWELK